MSAIADTGFVLAVLVKTDRFHQACKMVRRGERTVYLPVSALSEICYFLARDWGTKVAGEFLSNLPKAKYQLVDLTTEDLQRAGRLMTQYADARLDYVDATVIAVAERLNIHRVFTVDKRDFQMVRPSHVDSFEILP